MRRTCLLICLALLVFGDYVYATQYAYQVNFRDKNGTLTFSDSLTFLSPRSIARRATQGISLDSTDLPVTKGYVDSVIRLTGGKLHCTSKWLNLCVILLSDSTQIHALDAVSFVSSKKLVGYYTGTLHKAINNKNNIALSPLTPAERTTASGAYYGNTWPQTQLVNGNYLHDQGFKGAGKLIAVVDAGYSGTNTHAGFDSLFTSGRIVDVHNFTLANNNIYTYDTHGTEILSTMAGYVPDTFVGSAPLASYALYITEDDNSEQPIELLNMLSAAERADSLGADIITSSLGYNLFDNGADNLTFSTDLDGKTTIAAKAANIATKKGILFVTSAGNEGGDSWNNILTPGDADSALTIGNVDATGANASTSGFGPNASGQIKPDVCTLGQPGAVFNAAGGYGSVNGTSISTPEVAGWAACLWQAVPRATPALIRKAIISCASHYTTPGNQIGYGIPDFRCAIRQLNVDTPIPPTYDLTVTVSNPLKNTLDIIVTLKTAQLVNFTLSDVAGRKLIQFSNFFSSGKNSAETYDIGYLPHGIYFLKVATSTSQQVLKLVK